MASRLFDPRLRGVLEARCHERANIVTRAATISPLGEQRPGELQVREADVPCQIAHRLSAASGESDTGGSASRPQGAGSTALASTIFSFAREVELSTELLLQVLVGPNAGLYDIDRHYPDGLNLQRFAETTRVE